MIIKISNADAYLNPCSENCSAVAGIANLLSSNVGKDLPCVPGPALVHLAVAALAYHAQLLVALHEPGWSPRPAKNMKIIFNEFRGLIEPQN